jgi:ATP-dependent DNA helicase RecQ
MRNTAERIANYLIEQGESASFYHGGLPNAERSMRQDEWVNGKTRIMVATNAFGMGIDKRDVRFVVHYTMSDSLESYYQEAGRAGRDGERSYAVILMSATDNDRIINTFEKEFPDIEVVRSIYHDLCSYLGVAIGDGKEASFVFNIFDFCKRYKQPLAIVMSAIKLLQLNGYITLVEDCEHPARLMFMISRDELYNIKMQNEKEEEILRSILRLYTGIFSDFRPIDEMEIAAFSKHSHEDVHALLKHLWRSNIIRYIPTNHDPLIFLDEERLPSRDVYIAPETYSQRKSLMLERFNHLLHYANEEQECRSRIIEQYFCDKMSEPCGICDNCLARKKREKSNAANYEKQIIDLLVAEPMTIKEVVAKIVGNEQAIIEAVRQLTEKGTISAEGSKLNLKK